jgi:hypothetical protein
MTPRSSTTDIFRHVEGYRELRSIEMSGCSQICRSSQWSFMINIVLFLCLLFGWWTSGSYLQQRIFVRNKNEMNLLATTHQVVADGKDTFSHCSVVCHRTNGQNTGIPFVNRMAPPALASKVLRSYTDGQLKWVIDYSIWSSGMPGSKGMLNDDEIRSFVACLRHLPPSVTLGAPEIHRD